MLTVHIVSAVGLLRDSAGFLAVAIRAATTDDPALAAASYELLEMFSVVFGIPLSMITLATGLALGFGTKWGVLRYAWVTTKLLLVLSVILVGALVIGPSLSLMQDGSGGRRDRADPRRRLAGARAHARDRPVGVQARRSPVARPRPTRPRACANA